MKILFGSFRWPETHFSVGFSKTYLATRMTCSWCMTLGELIPAVTIDMADWIELAVDREVQTCSGGLLESLWRRQLQLLLNS